MMNAHQLLRQRRHDWQRLSDLLELAQRDARRLTPQQVEELSRLYRDATADLALARRDFPRHDVTRYLNQLVARGHATVYQEEPLALSRLRRFVRSDFPRAFRRLFLSCGRCPVHHTGHTGRLSSRLEPDRCSTTPAATGAGPGPDDRRARVVDRYSGF